MSEIIKKEMILKNGDFEGIRPPEYFNFTYPPDHFQLWAFKGISEMDNVLVTAHTGAGKTAPALYAIKMWQTLNSSNQVIYTSPIKTLSNQKFKEFGEHFDDVGILTGDVKINPSANLLIMTAEILRNSLLRKSNEKVYEWNFNPDRVKCVILDEVHFINNPDRGKVWEEIITNLDPSVQLVMLSATISGAENLAKWIAKLKNKNCYLIPTAFRPVPLHHYLYLENNIHCVKDNTSWKEGKWSDVVKSIKKIQKTKGKGKRGFDIKQLFDSIEYCRDHDIMPVNVFLLNRSLTEQVARKIPLNLLDSDEVSQVTKIWNKHLLKYREIYEATEQWTFLLSLAQKGIGVHHSGIIPILKEIIEILYESKLIKVLIATETFAMGVNMPTRTVIFTQTTKYDGDGKRPLRPEEYSQMAGRAGRRGLDTFGTVIILPEEDMPSESEAKKMIMSPPQTISSKLEIDHSFILKRLALKIEEGDTSPVLSYLAKSITNTMLASEVTCCSESLLLKQKELEEELEKCEVDTNLINKFTNYKMIKERIENNKTSFVKISQKVIKKLNNEMNSLGKELEPHLIKMNQYYDLNSQLKSIKSQLTFNQVQFENQIRMVLDYLKDTNIVSYKDDYSLTPLGRIVSEVNECNPLILGHIISNGYFDKLEFHEIVAFLSIFIADRSVEEPYISDLKISKDFAGMLDEIGKLVDSKMCEETRINNKLPYKFWSNWDLHLSMFEAIMEWSKNEVKWKEISHLYNTFEGNFCRNVLRLVNLLRNVESIAILTDNTNLINKLDGYQEKLIRDIVMIDSLYL